MTHFNHDWDTTKTPAVPVSVGDRYYAQDLNDDFNYLKHLPYEVFLQGKSRGVMVAPNDTWNNDTNSLTLSGGFGVILQDCIELDPNEDFVIPPKTHSSPRYERIPFADTVLTIPTDNTIRYIVATPTKQSLLQRTKTLFTEQYASRVRYDGVITIQDTAPTTGQILVGLCNSREYCLLIDSNPDQCKDNIILKKWFGQANITQNFVAILQSYYNTSIASIETKITIDGVGGIGIRSGTFTNCIITIGTADGGSIGIRDGVYNNCTITIGTVSGGGYGIRDGTFTNCTINCDSTFSADCIGDGTFNNCTIIIGTTDYVGTRNGVYNNCIITIDTIDFGGKGIYGGTFNNCIITINTVDSGDGYGVYNNAGVKLYLTHIKCTATTNLSNTGGKLNVLNDTVLHAS